MARINRARDGSIHRVRVHARVSSPSANACVKYDGFAAAEIAVERTNRRACDGLTALDLGFDAAT